MSDRDRSPSDEPGSEEERPPAAIYPQQAENIHSASKSQFVGFNSPTVGCQHILIGNTLGLYEQHLSQLQQCVSSLEQQVLEQREQEERKHQYAEKQIQLLEQQQSENQELLKQLNQQLAESREQLKHQQEENQKITRRMSELDMQLAKSKEQFQQMEQTLATNLEQLKETKDALEIQQLQVQKMQHQLQSQNPPQLDHKSKTEQLDVLQEGENSTVERFKGLVTQPEINPIQSGKSSKETDRRKQSLRRTRSFTSGSLGARNQQSGSMKPFATRLRRKSDGLSTEEGSDTENHTPQKRPRSARPRNRSVSESNAS